MANELVVSAGGTVAVPDAGGAVGDHVGDRSRETAHAPSYDWAPKDPAKLADIRRQMVRDFVIEGISESEIERWLPVLHDYAPAMRAAFKAADRLEAALLADRMRDDLIRKGLITFERIEQIRPILQRYAQESELALIGAGPSKASLSARRREIESMMSDNNPNYWKSEDVQNEYRDLIDRGVGVEGSSQVQDDKIFERIQEIDRWMGANKGSVDYKRYWADPSVQTEYSELIQRRAQALHNKNRRQ